VAAHVCAYNKRHISYDPDPDRDRDHDRNSDRDRDHDRDPAHAESWPAIKHATFISRSVAKT
jgi:hypothetical protein